MVALCLWVLFGVWLFVLLLLISIYLIVVFFGMSVTINCEVDDLLGVMLMWLFR